MKTYTSKSNAKRELKVALGKIDLELEDVAFEIVEADGHFVSEITFDASLDQVPDGVEILEEVAKVVILNAEPAEPEVEAPKRRASDYIREKSSHVGVCAEVWAIADAMANDAEEAGEKLSRKAVIEACRQAGIAFGTARTQYQKWKEHADALAAEAAAEKE